MKPKKPLPKNAVLALIVVGGLLVIAAGWMLAVKPEQKKAASLNDQTASVQQQIQSNLAAIAAARNVRAAPTITIAPVYKLAQAMPSAVDMPDLLLQLDEVAKASGVTLISISPGQASPSATGGYSTVAVSLSASGNFYSITDLLYRLRNLVSVRNGELDASGRLYSVQSVALAPSGRKVTASIGLQTFVYGEALSSTAPATTAAPTTTSTDTTATTTTQSSSSGPSAAGAQ